MENWDEDFSTLKVRPRTLSSKPLSAWKADIPLDEGDMTITKRRVPDLATKRALASRNVTVMDFDSEEDEDLADAFEKAVNLRQKSAFRGQTVVKPQATQYNDALELSDSGSTRSPGRTSSISSAQSFSSNATSWDDKVELNDSDFEFDNHPELDLKTRLRNRQERAKAEAAQEQAQLSAELAKTVKKRRSFRPMVELDDDLTDLGFERLPAKLKSGTVNKNIKFGLPPPSTPSGNPNISQPSKLLRGMRSIAQMPNQRTESPQKLRGAVSMLDLGSRKQPDFGNKYDLSTLKSRNQPLRSGSSTMAQPSSQYATLQQRPLTSYKDPNLPPLPSHRRHRPKKPNLIQYPGQTLSKQKFNGMTLNTTTGMWEGNEIDEAKFDLVLDPPVKPKLITKHSYMTPENPSREVNGMLFDKRTLSWVYANEDEYDDPFGAIDDDENDLNNANTHTKPFSDIPTASISHQRSAPTTPSSHASFQNQQLRRVTNESTISSSSSHSNLRQSVLRGESSGREVFDVSARQASEWRHIDERFMRKFGKWIGGDKEKADSLSSDQQFYEMVRNA